MMDIDKSSFPSNKALDTSLRMIGHKVNNEINGTPTILWTGNGYHIIQPIDATVLENIIELKIYEKPSEQFLRFAEWYLTDGKADGNHYNTLSFGNCLLRLPGSHNSKLIKGNNNTTDKSTQVKVIQEWDGYRPHIKLLLGTFHAYLVDQKIKGLNKNVQYSMSRWCSGTTNKIPWIESLIQTPISDSRKYCVWRILVPYLINVRKLSDEEAFSAILEWLERCNLIRTFV